MLCWQLESVSKFYNFSFEFEGIRVWGCYEIGSGKFVPYKEPFSPIRVSRVLKPDKKTTLDSPSGFVSPEPGCIKTFAKFANLNFI